MTMYRGLRFSTAEISASIPSDMYTKVASDSSSTAAVVIWLAEKSMHESMRTCNILKHEKH